MTNLIKIFAAFAVAAVMLTMNVKAADNFSTDQADGQFNVRVSVPIQVEADNSQADLGMMAPGVERTYTTDNKFVAFHVSGAAGWTINSNGQCNQYSDDGNQDIQVLDFKWLVRDEDNAWGTATDISSGPQNRSAVETGVALNNTLDTDINNGNRYYRAVMKKISCKQDAVGNNNAAASTRTVTVSLTATYQNI